LPLALETTEIDLAPPQPELAESDRSGHPLTLSFPFQVAGQAPAPRRASAGQTRSI
jgi:hypothetical protein